MAYRLGVDIGGTFTDIALIDETTGRIYTDKVSSTPQDPSGGFMEAVQRLLAKQQIAAKDVAYIVHGTTIATNAIIEGKVAPTGFITTEGFRDMLEIARQIRPTLYDLQFEKPQPLVPRHRCFGVPERLNAGGTVLTPLDEEALRQVAGALRAEGVEAIAICFLHAYANPVHEQRAGAILAEVFPEAVVSLSAEVAPEFREYLRASTTVINSCIRPVVARYLQRIENRLAQAGLAAELLVMQSSGGVYTFAAARQKPVYMVESGPAAGVIAAAHLGQARGYQHVISFDMGGTTAKAALIQDGAPNRTKDYEVGTTAQAGIGATRGAGYPIRTPVIDLVEIGAGGGSIAWVDPGGILRVGPQSAGADPGPACYGRGGTHPTVTDANLVLGRLNPSYFLGGEIAIDPVQEVAVAKGYTHLVSYDKDMANRHPPRMPVLLVDDPNDERYHIAPDDRTNEALERRTRLTASAAARLLNEAAPMARDYHAVLVEGLPASRVLTLVAQHRHRQHPEYEANLQRHIARQRAKSRDPDSRGAKPAD